MEKILLAQAKRLATKYLYELAIGIIGLLASRSNSSLKEDGDKIIKKLESNMQQDIEAGFAEEKAYSRSRRR